jgi:muconate cycloisomerase
MNPFNLESILEKMDLVLEGFPFTKAGVEMCLFDIQGKALNMPVHELIGGKYREWVPQSRSVGYTDVDKMVEWALMLKEMGSATIKVKTGIEGNHDIKALYAIREAIGADIHLKVDANTGWREPKEAIRVLKAITNCRIMLAEQPIRGWDLAGMAFIRRMVDIPIAADESVWDSHDVIRIFEKQAADILTIYLMKAGGIMRNREVAAAAKAVGYPCLLGGMGEMGVGSAANVHFAAAVPNLIYPADLHVPPFLIKDDLITEPLEYSFKGVKVPEGPGLGVSLDEAKLEKYRIYR